MKNGILFACVILAAACSGSKSDVQEPMPVTETEPAPSAESPTPTTEAPTTPDTATGMTEAQPPTPAPPPEPVAPPPVIASAELKAVKDDASMGTITFEKTADGKVTINGQFNGLKKGSAHALYIHEVGDCSNKGKKVGGHLNPTKAKHGPPASAERHAGDFGDVKADDAGNATFSMETDSITLEADRGDSVVNRAVVLHANKDDKKGIGGPVLACGVIQMQGGEQTGAQGMQGGQGTSGSTPGQTMPGQTGTGTGTGTSTTPSPKK